MGGHTRRDDVSQGMRSKFIRVSSHEWALGPGVGLTRRRRLVRATTFESLVRRIVGGLKILTHRRARLRDYPGYYRAEVTLKVDPTIVDLFHNSAAGYRAQYYQSVTNGESANEYAVQQLVPRVMRLLSAVRKRTCPGWWVQRSLLHPEAKLWIRQGPWLRHPKRSDRQLAVRRWLAYRWTKKHKQHWSSLIPKSETRIDLKGAPLTLDGTPLKKSLKPSRGRQIFEAGYT